MNKIEKVEGLYRKKSRNISKLAPGSVVKVETKIIEGGKARLQAFEGTLIGKQGRGLSETFTIRKIAAGGIGVERTFPLHSPMIESIKAVKQGEAKRAKLFYIRETFGKKARREAMRFDAGSTKEELESLSIKAEAGEEFKAEAYVKDSKKKEKKAAPPTTVKK